MTIRMPHISFGDRLLKAFGKKRGIRFPSEIYEEYGPYVYAVAQKESFWKALIRPKNVNLPDGYVDLFLFHRNVSGHRPQSE